MWRVFCAIEIPADVRQKMRGHIDALVQSAPGVKASWTNTESIHLTLKFLGNIAVDRIPAISEAAAIATDRLGSFTIQIGSSGVFPARSHAKVLWIGVNDSSGRLSELQERLEIECEKRGFPKEDRVFKPHLTIARLRGGNDARALVDAHIETEFPPQTVKVHELIVFRSELSARGSKYTALSKHTLT